MIGWSDSQPGSKLKEEDPRGYNGGPMTNINPSGRDTDNMLGHGRGEAGTTNKKGHYAPYPDGKFVRQKVASRDEFLCKRGHKARPTPILPSAKLIGA